MNRNYYYYDCNVESRNNLALKRVFDAAKRFYNTRNRLCFALRNMPGDPIPDHEVLLTIKHRVTSSGHGVTHLNSEASKNCDYDPSDFLQLSPESLLEVTIQIEQMVNDYEEQVKKVLCEIAVESEQRMKAAAPALSQLYGNLGCAKRLRVLADQIEQS